MDTTNENTEESSSDFKTDLLDELDILKLVPETARRALFYPIMFFVISIGFITGIFFFLDDILWVFFLFLGFFFLVTSLGIFRIERRKISRDRNTYIFSRDGLIIIAKNGSEKTIPWSQISDLEILNLHAKSVVARRCIISSIEGQINIKINCFKEVTEDIMYPNPIAEAIEKYYERVSK
ncbi:MAG: hypothetical protein KAS63_08705 [Candidatus Heimdallarchaeota archaeon]|nr:hypothetical protein [Candidatus Heimdallarchaeota archaeon]MCK4955427.1 hypothetical protein [Candidatus Heimdallarchaeota archaeon]